MTIDNNSKFIWNTEQQEKTFGDKSSNILTNIKLVQVELNSDSIDKILDILH